MDIRPHGPYVLFGSQVFYINPGDFFKNDEYKDTATPYEHLFILGLLKHAYTSLGTFISASSLVQSVYGQDDPSACGNIHQHASTLRNKLYDPDDVEKLKKLYERKDVKKTTKLTPLLSSPKGYLIWVPEENWFCTLDEIQKRILLIQEQRGLLENPKPLFD